MSVSVIHDRLSAPFQANQKHISMTIQVRFFASLREQLGMAEQQFESSDNLSVAQVWQQVTGVEMPANTLMAVNMEYVDGKHAVSDGDEVAFFPPVTGG